MHPVKNASFVLETSNQWFFLLLLYQLPGPAIFLRVSCLNKKNHYHINGLHLFGGSFEWFCLQISSNAKYFFLSCSRHCDWGLIVRYFQIWKKKKKKKENIRLLFELFAITWVPFILRHPILKQKSNDFNIFFEASELILLVEW